MGWCCSTYLKIWTCHWNGVVGRGQKKFEENDWYCFDCLNPTVIRNRDANHSPSENSKKGGHSREILYCLRQYLKHYEQTGGRH